jgi:hypothetical protein
VADAGVVVTRRVSPRRAAGAATPIAPAPRPPDPVPPEMRARIARSVRCGQSIQRARSFVLDVRGEATDPFLLPPYQRPAVWTIDQSAAFLTRLMRGFPGGTVLLWERHNEARAAREWWLIDGQQRLTALGARVLRADGTANPTPVLHLDLDAFATAPDDAPIWFPEPRGAFSPTVADLMDYHYLWDRRDEVGPGDLAWHLLIAAQEAIQNAEFHTMQAGGWSGDRVTAADVRDLFVAVNTGGTPMSAEDVAALMAIGT